MNTLRFLRMDWLKVASARVMQVFIILPALLAFNGWFVSIALLLHFYTVTYGIFSYDDHCAADQLFGVLPINREQVVSGRYLFALSSLLLMAGLMLLVHGLYCALLGQAAWQPEFVLPLVLTCAAGLIFAGVVYPLVLLRGQVWANQYVLLTFVAVFIFVGTANEALATRLAAGLPPQYNIWGIFVLSLAVFVASYLLCQQLYRRKEYWDLQRMDPVRREKRKRDS